MEENFDQQNVTNEETFEEESTYLVPAEEEIEENSGSGLGYVIATGIGIGLGVIGTKVVGAVRYAMSDEGKAEREVKKAARRQKREEKKKGKTKNAVVEATAVEVETKDDTKIEK